MGLTKEEIAEVTAGIMAQVKEIIKPPTAPAGEKSTAEKAAEAETARLEQARIISETESATKFEIGFDKMREDYKAFLPSETESIVNFVNGQKHENKIDKARDLKVALMDAFFKVQKNIDVLNSTFKDKVSAYNGLTQEAKRKEANVYWEVLEVALENHKLIGKGQAANRANGQPGGGSDEEYNAKVFKKADTRHKKAIGEE